MTTREDREAALLRYYNSIELKAGGRLSKWVETGHDQLLGAATSLEMIGFAKGLAAGRAEGAAAALADPERVVPAFEALCKAEGALTIEIWCTHGKVKVYLDGQPSLRAACKYALRKREEARRG